MNSSKVSNNILLEEKVIVEQQQLKLNEKQSYLIIKRVFDIILAFFGLVVLFPFLTIIAILIKIEDPKGKVLFKQARVGKDGQEFNMFKFRSMVSNAEEMLESLLAYNEASGAMFKMKDDPRITKVGKFIRKTSIDELPQLWNVIKGEMSLVGPRPPLPREVKEYSTYERQRLLVVPGCTGLWQISGRSNLGFKEMVNLDLKYIKNRNFRYDLKILLKTVKVLAIQRGAY